eukprot:Gb_06777 [translate_table: standard]
MHVFSTIGIRALDLQVYAWELPGVAGNACNGLTPTVTLQLAAVVYKRFVADGALQLRIYVTKIMAKLILKAMCMRKGLYLCYRLWNTMKMTEEPVKSQKWMFMNLVETSISHGRLAEIERNEMVADLVYGSNFNQFAVIKKPDVKVCTVEENSTWAGRSDPETNGHGP